MYVPGYSPLWVKSRNNLDLLTHFIWAGKQVKEQTDITSFVDRFRKLSVKLFVKYFSLTINRHVKQES